MKVACLLLAAGRGTRFGGPVPKAYLQLEDRPLLLHSAERLARAIDFTAGNRLVIVAGAADDELIAPWRDRLTALGDVHFAIGGDSRQASMQNGLATLANDGLPAEEELVLVHDAARALLPITATRECVDAARTTGAALLAVPAADTLKNVDGDKVRQTLDRAGIWQAQTPQIVRRDLLQRAFDHAHATGFAGTDDVSLVEHLGEPVAVVHGHATNLKITRPEDLPLAAAILAAGLID